MSKILFTMHRCVDHSIHQATYHFIKALGIPSLMKTPKKTLRMWAAEDDDDMEAENLEEDTEDDDVDVDILMDLEASADEA